MKLLHEKLTVLDEAQRKILFDLLRKENKELELKLARVLLRARSLVDLPTSSQIACKVYDSFEASKFSHLKRRLSDAVDRVLTLNVGSFTSSSTFRKRRKRLLSGLGAALALEEKGAYLASKTQFESLCKDLRGSQFIEEEILIRSLANRIFLTDGETYSRNNKEIAGRLEVLRSAMELESNAMQLSQELITKHRKEQRSEAVNFDFRGDIKEMEWRVARPLLKIQVYKCVLENRHEEILDVVSKYSKLMGQSCSVADQVMYQVFYANGLMYCGNFLAASRFYKDARDKYAIGCDNYNNVALYLAQSLIHAKMAGEARSSLAAQEGSKLQGENFEFEFRLQFGLAAIDFMESKFPECQAKLLYNSKLYQTSLKYRASNQLLLAMTYLELQFLDSIDHLLDSMRKLSYKLDGRLGSQVRIIRAIVVSFMDFNLVATKHADDLALLRSGEGDYFWDPLGYEIIRFDEWFDKKVAEQNKKGRRRHSVKRRRKVRGT